MIEKCIYLQSKNSKVKTQKTWTRLFFYKLADFGAVDLNEVYARRDGSAVDSLQFAVCRGRR